MIRHPEEAYSLGIDLGTSSCKVCAVDRQGRTAGTASSGYETHSPHSGWAEQDPADWIEAISAAAAKLWKDGGIDPGSVVRVTLTSAAHIGVLVDGKSLPVRRALLWSDQRSREEADRLRADHGEYILAHGFNNVSTSWTLPHLVWIREREPEVWGNVKGMFLSKDYLLYKLTGEKKTDPATAVSALLYDAVSNQWSEKLCSLAGIDPRVLPAVTPAGEVAGYLSKEGGKVLGLQAGLPVFNGTLDSAMETYGAGAAESGDFVIRVGTAGGIHVIKAEPSPNAKLLTYPFPVKGLWYSQAGTSSAGSAVAWAVTSAGGAKSPEEFRAFGREAEKAPAGADGLLFHPYLSGERTPYWEPTLRGTFSGASFRHRKAHFARAVLEGIAYSLCDAFIAITERSSIPDRVRVVGGGTLEPLLMEILSSVLGRTLIAMKNVDSAYGAALFGLHAGGTRSPSESESREDSVSFVSPNAKDSAAYEKAFENYRSACPHLLAMYRERAASENRSARSPLPEGNPSKVN